MTSVQQHLNAALARLLEADPGVFVLGEDLSDPYGGAFGVTRGLSTRFPDRVRSTPISEAALVGVAVGMALRGMVPVVEIMFGDFLWLAADQLLNHAAMLAAVHAGRLEVPLTLRTPMGGRRGYGPSHSQSLEARLLNVPGLLVVATSALHDPGALLEQAVRAPWPTLHIEHKRMYARPVRVPGAGLLDGFEAAAEGAWPTLTLSADRRGAALTLVAYGDAAELAFDAARRALIEREVCVDVVVPALLSPLDLAPVLRSLDRSGRLLVVEEGAGGFGAEVIARVVEAAPERLKAAPRRICAAPHPVYAAPSLEDAVLPHPDTILAAILSAP